MSKKKKKNKGNYLGSGQVKKDNKGDKGNRFLEELRLHPDTIKSIWAVVFFGIFLVLSLANFEKAGPVGKFLYKIFSYLLGEWGYYLLPIIFLVMAGVFVMSERKKLYGITFIGAVIFVLSGLGFIDIVFEGEKAGFLGKFFGLIENLFGFTASLVIIIVLITVSLLITLNIPIKFKRGINEEEIESGEAYVAEQKELFTEIPERTEEGKEEPEEETGNNIGVAEKISSILPLPIKAKKDFSLKQKDIDYVFPTLDLLKSSVEKPTSGDLRANANIIKRTLESFGIPVEMGEINIGPKVTRYTLKPAEGIKLSRILALSQDLALALAAHPIRIEAPIPGKSLVGIEVPNKAAALVRLGSLMHYPDFTSSGLLSFTLGRDVTGEPIFADIKKMPHLLIAGSTGAGKSVAIHSLILSLIYKNAPKTLRLIMIDPKRVELSVYEGIPHLVAPVVTESKKALGVFKWAINEMDKRYETLLHSGSRDILSYNKKFTEMPLPYVVIVVDELADLMSTYGREVEGSIVRLAQMARATGIHLIVSTQRPSVEVITGLIKANITSRMALQVASQVDSRTILDTSGAEKLLGGGDMLFVSSELSKPKRIQGAYISEEEISKVAEFVRKNNKGIVDEEEAPTFENGNGDLSTGSGQAGSGQSGDLWDEFASNEDDDELLQEAIEIVTQAEKASASLLQRRLRVGYARAARLLDIMEERGIVGPADGAKPREVFREKN